LTPEHVLVAGEEDPRIVGLIDFADALVGPAEYELTAPVVHLFHGDREALHSFLDGFGWSPDRRGPDQACRLLAWWILHRFANLPRLVPADLDALPAGDLGALAARCFPL
jgi:hygromycin-B 7''-O-kinase